MNDLAQMIDEAAAAIRGSGALRAISLYPTADGWQANVKRKINGQEGWCCCASRSPSAALLDALRGATSASVVQDRPRAEAAPAATGEDIFG